MLENQNNRVKALSVTSFTMDTRKNKKAQKPKDEIMTEQNTFSISELQQKANDGDAQAQFDLALCYAKGTDIEKNAELALDWHKKAAEQGHAKAQFALGLYHLLGNDQGQQTEKFLNKWLRDKFVVKNVDPALDLAVSLVFETKLWGTNDDMAFAWLKKAAEQVSSEAQYCLAHCYRGGVGVNQNDELTFDGFKKAAEQGYADAYY